MKRRLVTISLLLFLCVILNSRHTYAQTGPEAVDSLLSKITYYGIKKSQSILFAHLDKTVYVNNENVWFTAYLLTYNKAKNNSTFLTALLVNDRGRSISVKQRFVMANGLSFGNIMIPDNLPPGDYSLILYTNELINGKPVETFIQPITIKATSKPIIAAALNIIDTSKIGYRKIKVTATDKDGRPLLGAEVNYSLGNQVSGKVKADQYGQYELSIPAEQITTDNNLLSVDISYKKDRQNIQLSLPVAKNQLNIKFYPEGGSLVHATQSIIGWEAKDVYGMPVKLNAILYNDKHAIDTIYTDSYGIGRFKLIPMQGGKYGIRLIGVSDSVYQLPKILNKGPVMTISKALTDDSLKLRLVSKYAGKYYLLIHNYRQAFFRIPVEIGPTGKNILINLADVPKGLSTITVLDSLHRPCAERIFFAHYNRRTKTDITTDRSEYTTRQKVELKFKLNSSALDTLRGIVSVACVQSNRMEIRKVNDIESYVYLRHELENMPEKVNYMGQDTEDKTYLENILLIKGWRKYKWQELSNTRAQDTIKSVSFIPPFEGVVSQHGKAVKKITPIMVITDSTVNIVSTDQTGHLILTGENMINNNGRKTHLLLKNHDLGYSIKVLDNFKQIDSLLVTEPCPLSKGVPSFNVTTDLQIIGGLEHAINLKEVKITAKNENQIYQLHSYDRRKENECGDYVCRYNVLNCQNHPHEDDNRAPVVGQTYFDGFRGPSVYKGCVVIPKTTMLAIDGVSYSKEFYAADYSLINPSQPEYLSTLFWKHACLINSKNETKLSFYTSDITGPFKIIVQGIVANDVIYGEKEFTVKKP